MCVCISAFWWELRVEGIVSDRPHDRWRMETISDWAFQPVGSMALSGQRDGSMLCVFCKREGSQPCHVFFMSPSTSRTLTAATLPPSWSTLFPTELFRRNLHNSSSLNKRIKVRIKIQILASQRGPKPSQNPKRRWRATGWTFSILLLLLSIISSLLQTSKPAEFKVLVGRASCFARFAPRFSKSL